MRTFALKATLLGAVEYLRILTLRVHFWKPRTRVPKMNLRKRSTIYAVTPAKMNLRKRSTIYAVTPAGNARRSTR